MNVGQWIAERPEAAAMLAFALIALVFSLFEASRFRRFERRMLREQRALLNRVQEEEKRRQESLGTLASVLSESSRASEERMRAASESVASMAAETRSLNRDVRESALRQQIDVREALDQKLKELQLSNEKKLDSIREAVDEKLQSTLQQRLGESFRQVSDQLERVYRGIGEMRTLAGSVGDLQRVLQNVTVRGAWGEARLESILKQNLSPSQYLANTAVEPGASERVEFAVVLPGGGQEQLLLPVDSKFPQADYERVVDAARLADKPALDAARASLSKALVTEAKRISTKYLRPPYTTDFAVMFLPTEGLFAEAMQYPGLSDAIQREQRVILAGPTTFTALLTSLQMGFRTLAVEKRSVEVWRLLGAVRKEFALFGESIEKTRRRLEQASTELDGAASRSRAINRRLTEADDPDPASIPEDAPD